MGFLGKIKEMYHSWNAFQAQERTPEFHSTGAVTSFGHRPDRNRSRWNTERTILASIITRLSMDAAAIDIRHVRTDDNDRYVEDIDSGLNNCLKVEANIDQGARHFRQDLYSTMLETGTTSAVPIDTSEDPEVIGSYDIKTLRVGEVVQWWPRRIGMKVYNDIKGQRQDLVMDKKVVAIAENPFYSVMNEPNSTLKRLTHKLQLLDAVDDQLSSGKLDLIIQLPYVIKSPARREQANQRRTDIEDQLKGSKYGIAYTDGTEKITQLNRPAENNLLVQVESLTKQLYTELGLTPEIMNGTADEAAMLNYYTRTIEPIVTAVVEAMRRTFLTRTGRSQKQSIMFFRDPFKLVPVSQLADIADKFTRNKIATPNDIRQIVGWKPSKDPSADKLENANMPQTPDPSKAPPEDILRNTKPIDLRRPVGTGPPSPNGKENGQNGRSS
jgi:hypothetical protein